MSSRRDEYLTVACGGISFCAAAACFGAIVSVLRLFARPEGSDGALVAPNLAMLAYMLLVSAGLNAIGFTLVTALSAAWRQQGPRRAVALGAGFGAVALVLQLTGAAFHVPLLRSLVQLVPRASGFVLFGMPGVVLGCLAVAGAWLARSRARA